MKTTTSKKLSLEKFEVARLRNPGKVLAGQKPAPDITITNHHTLKTLESSFPF